jgi:hypothetical protein
MTAKIHKRPNIGLSAKVERGRKWQLATRACGAALSSWMTAVGHEE